MKLGLSEKAQWLTFLLLPIKNLLRLLQIFTLYSIILYNWHQILLIRVNIIDMGQLIGSHIVRQ